MYFLLKCFVTVGEEFVMNNFIRGITHICYQIIHKLIIFLNLFIHNFKNIQIFWQIISQPQAFWGEFCLPVNNLSPCCDKLCWSQCISLLCVSSQFVQNLVAGWRKAALPGLYFLLKYRYRNMLSVQLLIFSYSVYNTAAVLFSRKMANGPGYSLVPPVVV